MKTFESHYFKMDGYHILLNMSKKQDRRFLYLGILYTILNDLPNPAPYKLSIVGNITSIPNHEDVSYSVVCY